MFECGKGSRDYLFFTYDIVRAGSRLVQTLFNGVAKPVGSLAMVRAVVTNAQNAKRKFCPRIGSWLFGRTDLNDAFGVGAFARGERAFAGQAAPAPPCSV